MWSKIVVAVLAGAVGAVMANRGVALFHDGLRALLPEVMGGRMRRGEFASVAVGMSAGLVFGFGLPFSLMSGIVLYHTLWLGTDIIGTRLPGPAEAQPGRGRPAGWPAIAAALGGGLYGGLLAAALQGVDRLMARLPVRVLDARGLLAAPILLTFAAFPAVAVAYQHGIGKGGLTLALALLARLGAGLLDLPQPDLWALGVGMAVLLVLAVRDRGSAGPGAAPAAFPTQGAGRIRAHLPAIAVLGAVYGLACNQGVLMESPQSLLAVAQRNTGLAAGVAVARALSFTPLKVMSGLATGVFAIDGLGFVAATGLVAPNAVLAALGGAIVMSLEAAGLAAIARVLARYPALLRAADNSRTAMTRLLEVASLVGSMMAAHGLAPGYGFAVVAGLYLLNEVAGAPLVRAAVGPVALLGVGVVANLLAWAGA